MFAYENLIKHTLNRDDRNGSHYVKKKKCVSKVVRKLFRCVYVCFMVEWKQWSYDASLGLFPTRTLCQIERPSADRPRSSLDHVYVCACSRAWACTVMHVCRCVYVCVCVCVHLQISQGSNPSWQSVQPHHITVTPLSHSDEWWKESRGRKRWREWMTENGRSHWTHLKKVLWCTLVCTVRRAERGGWRKTNKTNQLPCDNEYWLNWKSVLSWFPLN